SGGNRVLPGGRAPLVGRVPSRARLLCRVVATPSAGATCGPTRLPEAGLQTDCKRPVRDGLSVAVTRRYGRRFETARRGRVWHGLTAAVRTLGKLITQRSQVQILSPQRRRSRRS